MQNNFHRLCLVCNADALKPLKGYEQHDLVKCDDCGFVFMHKIPSLQELQSYYSVYAYESEKVISEPTRMSLESLLDFCEAYRENNRMLDVGCGEGWILELAKKRGWDVYGTEFSDRAIEICEKKGIKMYAGVLDETKIEIRDFDVIISSETIEHINNPRSELSNINKLLRKGGLFYITTPNFNSYIRYMVKSRYDIIRYPEHLSYYTRTTLNFLLNKNGFSKVKLLTTGISVSRYMNSKVSGSQKKPVNRNKDEEIRKRVAHSRSLQVIKRVVNLGLTVLGLGMTLKAFYSKK